MAFRTTLASSDGNQYLKTLVLPPSFFSSRFEVSALGQLILSFTRGLDHLPWRQQVIGFCPEKRSHVRHEI